MEPPCLADELSDRRQRTAGAGYTPAGASMGEDSNIGIAEALSDHREHRAAEPSQRPWQRLAVIIEAAFLAIVAIATAWSGYQAAKWDGRQAELYGDASTIRIDADQQLTLGGQQRLLDVSTFNTWIEARAQGRQELAALYERRFSPEFKVAFDAWLATRPFASPDAPPGPSFMPEYINPQIEKGLELNERGDRVFDEGTAARRHADDYIRTTVVLATVLFMLALSQRFKVLKIRVGVLVVAGGLMIYGLVTIATFPRL